MCQLLHRVLRILVPQTPEHQPCNLAADAAAPHAAQGRFDDVGVVAVLAASRALLIFVTPSCVVVAVATALIEDLQHIFPTDAVHFEKQVLEEGLPAEIAEIVIFVLIG